MPERTVNDLIEEINGNKQFRTLTIQREQVNEESRTVEISFSSDIPYERYWGVEILGHNDNEMRLDRLKNSAPLLWNHDWDRQIGVVDKVWIGEDRKGRALVRFSRSAAAEEIYQDVLDGICRNVSVGYMVHKMILVEENEGLATYRATDWEPFEVSLAPVPADTSVGVGRSIEKDPIITNQRGNSMAKEDLNTPEVIDIAAERAQARKDEQARVREISAIAEKHPFLKDEARDFINSDKSANDFRMIAIDKIAEQVNKKNIIDLELSQKEEKEYSITRAIMWAADGNKEFDGVEADIHRQIEKQLGRSSKGVFVPMSIRAPYVAASGGQGAGYTVDTEVRDLITLLRNKMLTRELGATVLSGLTSNIGFPRQSAASTLYWTGENPGSDVTESEGTLDQVSLSPKTAQATTTYSRQLMQQSSLDVESFVRNDLAAINALGLDLAAINGSGASNQPRGVLNVSGIGSVAGGTNGLAPTWAHIVTLEQLVAVANADFGSLAYLSNAKVRGKLKQTQKVTTYGNDFIWEKGALPGYGEMNGYKAGVSNQVPSTLVKGTSGAVCSAIIFGNWADLLIGEFGVLELIVDPYAKKKQGLLEVTSFIMADIAVRHPESFAAMVDALTA
jgi:HK97 family phage major capsid protein/HK97 family phage prohead protease